MAEIDTAAGAKFYIGPQNSVADDATAYGLLSFTEVTPVEDLGEWGDTHTGVPFTSLGDSRTQELKGSVTGGTLPVVVGLDETDAGQIAVKAALPVKGQYAFKVELALKGGESTPVTYFFRGLVMSFTKNVGSADNVVRATINVSVNSDEVYVAAT